MQRHPFWALDAQSPPIVAKACSSGAQIAHCVWQFYYQSLEWRHPDLPAQAGDYGITWYELAVHSFLFAGFRPKSLPSPMISIYLE